MEPVPMAAAVAGMPGVVDGAGMVVTDVNCRRCSYNLRGLNYQWRCPECGTPIGLSIQGDLLRYADPEWLAKLGRGVSIILWGILVGLVVGAIGGALFGRAPVTKPLISMLAGLMGLYGSWLLTEPDPSGLNEGQYMTARKVVRFALLVGLGSSVLQVFGVAVGLRGAALILFVLLQVAAGLIGVVGEFAKLTYLEMMAKRIPDDALAGRAHFLKWAYGISLGVVAVFGGLALLIGVSGGAAARSSMMSVGCVALVAGIALIVFGIMQLFFLYRMGQAFRVQEQAARGVWAQSVAGGAPQG